jgi:hypothetical protein
VVAGTVEMTRNRAPCGRGIVFVLAVDDECWLSVVHVLAFRRISISIFYSKPQSENSHFSHRFLITLFTYSPRSLISFIKNFQHETLSFLNSDIYILSTRLRVVAITDGPDWMVNQSTKVDQSAAEMPLTYLTKNEYF